MQLERRTPMRRDQSVLQRAVLEAGAPVQGKLPVGRDSAEPTFERGEANAVSVFRSQRP